MECVSGNQLNLEAEMNRIVKLKQSRHLFGHGKISYTNGQPSWPNDILEEWKPQEREPATKRKTYGGKLKAGEPDEDEPMRLTKRKQNFISCQFSGVIVDD